MAFPGEFGGKQEIIYEGDFYNDNINGKKRKVVKFNNMKRLWNYEVAKW